MKRQYICILLLLIAATACHIPAYAQENVKKVAILEPIDRKGEINEGVKLLLRTSLAKAITNTPGFEAYTRDIAGIIKEQQFQRTGMVQDAEIKQIGKMTGVSYVLKIEVAKYDARNVILTADILDVVTAGIVKTDGVTAGIEASEMAKACNSLAQKLLENAGSPIVAEYENTISYFRVENERLVEIVNQRNNDIARLKKSLAEDEARIESLQQELSALKDAYAVMERMLNESLYEVYFLFGTKDGLENWRNLPRSRYTKADYRYFDVFETKHRNSKNMYLKTPHPAGSYKWDLSNSNNTRIVILDKEKFWSISRYCVIQTQ
ncbi:MAG: hypothetical protein NC396_03050 [Bacteroides sp.]|nr:hypothetical protein [Bacteroides sp.]MCM1085191.1 hypothetical protein [Bacteroides sp.]